MSNALKAVVGIVAIVVGVVFPVTSEYLIPLGASLLLNAAAALFVKAPRAPPLSGIGINYSGTLEPRRLIYGVPHSTGSNSEDFMQQVLAAVERGGVRSVRS
jgi:hypothetical protein